MEKDKVYIVMEEYWNGTDDAERVCKVFHNEERAKEFCRVLNSGRKSAYSSLYTYDIHDVE